MRDGLLGSDFVGSLDPFRRDLESPSQDERDRKTDGEDENDEPHRPVRDVKKGKDLSRDLDEEPRNHRIGDGHLVDVSPLQFGEKIARVQISESAALIAAE